MVKILNLKRRNEHQSYVTTKVFGAIITKDHFKKNLNNQVKKINVKIKNPFH